MSLKERRITLVETRKLQERYGDQVIELSEYEAVNERIKLRENEGCIKNRISDEEALHAAGIKAIVSVNESNMRFTEVTTNTSDEEKLIEERLKMNESRR